jgi:hypothetical protein
MKLTTHLHLVPRSRMRGAIPPLPQHAFMAWCSFKKAQGQLYIHTYIHTYTHTHTHTHINIHTYTLTYTYIHYHTHTYTHARTSLYVCVLHSEDVSSLQLQCLFISMLSSHLVQRSLGRDLFEPSKGTAMTGFTAIFRSSGRMSGILP